MSERMNLSRRDFLILGGGAALTSAVTAADSTTVGSHARLNKKDGWYKYCRPYLEELNPRDDLDLVPYVRDMVARAKTVKADPLVMLADDGGYPLYPSKLAPINCHVHGQDLLGMIEQECRQQGLRFGLGFVGTHTNNYIDATHPDWAMRDSSGKTYPFYEGHLICLNSPYREYYADLIREALARYPVDYTYVEGIYVRPQGCYCPTCRDKFKAAHGKDLDQASTDERLRFWSDGLAAFIAAVKAAVDAVSPETAVIGTSYYEQWGLIACDLETFSKYTDMVGLENQWGFDHSRSLHTAGLDMLRLKARARKPIVGTWWASENVDLNYHQRSPAHARLTFMQTLAYGAAVQPHIQSVFGFETCLMPVLTELFSCVERVRNYLLDADPLPYIAVLDGPGATAYCNALLELHLPFDLITAEQANQKRLGAYRAVIVGDGGGLREQGLAELAAYVKVGGGLMCAGQVGEGLAGLAGVSLDGQIDSGRSGLPFYYRFDSDASMWRDLHGRLLSFRHACAKVTPAADCRVEARIIGLDLGRLDKEHMTIKPYPGPPLGPMAVTRNVGAGRVLYLAGDLASIAAPGNVADADVLVVLAQAALWTAGGQPPVTTNAPPSVELVTYVKRHRLAIFVMNETTNQFENTGVIRYVVPLRDVEIRVRTDAPVRSVTAVTGQPAPYEVRDQWLTVRLPKINEYEILMVDLAEA
jgi:hypothetical protein